MCVLLRNDLQSIDISSNPNLECVPECFRDSDYSFRVRFDSFLPTCPSAVIWTMDIETIISGISLGNWNIENFVNSNILSFRTMMSDALNVGLSTISETLTVEDSPSNVVTSILVIVSLNYEGTEGEGIICRNDVVTILNTSLSDGTLTDLLNNAADSNNAHIQLRTQAQVIRLNFGQAIATAYPEEESDEGIFGSFFEYIIFAALLVFIAIGSYSLISYVEVIAGKDQQVVVPDNDDDYEVNYERFPGDESLNDQVPAPRAKRGSTIVAPPVPRTRYSMIGQPGIGTNLLQRPIQGQGQGQGQGPKRSPRQTVKKKKGAAQSVVSSNPSPRRSNTLSPRASIGAISE